MPVLVTGGAGFIGSHVCERFLSEGHEVVCIDDLNDFYDPEIKKENLSILEGRSFRFIKADIRSTEETEKAFRDVNSVIHLAARAGIQPSLKNPILYEEVNVKGTLNMLELCRKYNIDNFIFGSSSSVYGVNSNVPFSEGDRIDEPISPYAASKIAGESLCHVYSYLYGIKTSCLRFFTVYGPRGRPDMAVYKFTKLIEEGKPIVIYGDGTTKRDYTYVSDIVDGLMCAWKKKFMYELFNLGNSNAVELNHLASFIGNALEKKVRIVYKPMQVGDVPTTYADITKSRRILGYKPKFKIEDGIKKFVEWYRENRK